MCRGASRLRVPFLHQHKLQVPPLRYPEFPVEVGGVGEPRAAFFTDVALGGGRDVGNPDPLQSG